MMSAYELPTIESKLDMIDTLIAKHRESLLILDELRISLTIEKSIQSNKVRDQAADKEIYDNERQMGEHEDRWSTQEFINDLYDNDSPIGDSI
jgi:hypothetical protein